MLSSILCRRVVISVVYCCGAFVVVLIVCPDVSCCVVLCVVVTGLLCRGSWYDIRARFKAVFSLFGLTVDIIIELRKFRYPAYFIRGNINPY